MFDRFRNEFAVGQYRDRPSIAPSVDERLTAVAGYQAFASEFAGASFDGGLYRVHDDVSAASAFAFIVEYFPLKHSSVFPFGYDWLGRQFVLDHDRIEAGEALVSLLEPGTGEVLEIPGSFETFHEEVLFEHRDAALADKFFSAWTERNPTAVPLARDECAGYQIPLFLGGRDEVDNLEVTDIEVYWSLCGQLFGGVANLRPGQSIGDVRAIDDEA